MYEEADKIQIDIRNEISIRQLDSRSNKNKDAEDRDNTHMHTYSYIKYEHINI